MGMIYAIFAMDWHSYFGSIMQFGAGEIMSSFSIVLAMFSSLLFSTLFLFWAFCRHYFHYSFCQTVTIAAWHILCYDGKQRRLFVGLTSSSCEKMSMKISGSWPMYDFVCLSK